MPVHLRGDSMTLSAGEITLCNQALDRIGAAQIASTSTTTNEYLVCDRNYPQVRDTLLRSFEWNFVNARETLALVYDIDFGTAPGPDEFAVGDVLTGITSGVTATVLEVISGTQYRIGYVTGTYTLGETVTNATVSSVEWQGIPVVYGTSPVVWYENGDQVVCGALYPTVTEVVPNFGYQHMYVLPDDFSRLRVKQKFQHEHAIEGKYLLSHHDTEKIEYVRKTTDTTLFDDLFVDCLILKLALTLLNPLAGTASASTKEQLKQDFKESIAKARQVGKMEDTTPKHHPWLNARYKDSRVGTYYH
jgi:hypothetical protein